MNPKYRQTHLPPVTSFARSNALCINRKKSTHLRALSALALLLGVGAMQAQDKAADAPPSTDEAVKLEAYDVTGIRASLVSAQEIKENAPAFVDSIVAQDIGKLPDNTVADALQRIAGVQVARAAGEAINPVIHGLPNIETTINGYEVFTGTGRGVALQDIPAEMLLGIDVYKTIGPDQVEGGVAGLIDVRLRRPLDFAPGVTTDLNVRGMYSSQADKDSYFISGLVNDRWKTADGDFGVMIDVSFQKRRYEDQIWDTYVHQGAPGLFFDSAADSTGKRGYFADNSGYQIIPGDRTRPAVDLAFQWRTNSGVELYSENLFTGYRNTHQVNFFILIPSFGGTKSNVTFFPAGNDGVNIPDLNSLNGPNTNDLFVKTITATDSNTIASMQSFKDSTNTYQGAFGGKWDHGNVKLDAEISYNVSTVRTHGEILDTITSSPTEQLAFTYNEGTGATVKASGLDYTNGNNYFINQLFDQWSKAYSQQYAIKSDALIRLSGTDFLRSAEFGVRYSDRDVHFHQANPGPIPVPGPFLSTPASAIPGLGGVFTNKLFVPADQLNIRSWWSPSPSFLLDDTDQIRALVGRPAGSPPSDPASTFNDKEQDFAIYGLVNYGASVGSMPLDGVLGVRFVDTHQTLGGYQHPIDATGNSNFAVFVPTNLSNAQWEALPTLNGKLKLADNLFLRYSGTKTVTRPNFADLNPALTLASSGPTSLGSGNGGNPNLEPIKSTNYDLSLEYYFAKSSLVSVAGFDHELKGYVQSFGTTELVGTTNYFITRPQNTDSGSLKGFELNYQQFLDFLPSAFKGLGVQANYTYIDGKTDDPFHVGQKEQITQVAKNNYNLILIYERGGFSSRLAYTWRGTYIDSYNQPGIQPSTVYVEPTKQLDFSASYDLTKQITLTFDITNLLGSKYRDHFGPTQMFTRDERNYDTTYALGARFKF